ncbi:MAG: hypothetical protein Q4C86_01740 [bacterium]|nr:hypothetical protein [bacterium]
MEVMKFVNVGFGWQDMLANSLKRGRNKQASEDMSEIAQRAYYEGVKVLKMRSVLEIYKKERDFEDCIVISHPEGGEERLYVGPRAGYLIPAQEVAVLLCSVGMPLVALMQEYAKAENYLMMYYLDVLGVQALAEISGKMRAHVESLAAEKGWGVSPSMQPGSVDGWSVEGQRDLYRLGNGGKIGLSLNDSSFLIPHISNSSLIGIGPHYSENNVGSLCHECPRYRSCLWRRENIEKN